MADESVPERWLPVPGYEGFYEISDLGRARALDRVILCADGTRRRYRGRALHAGVGSGGYLEINTRRHRPAKIHRLVLHAFVGPPPPGAHACHGNGIRTDNRLANLRWDAPIGNIRDRDRHGTTARGERAGTAKLTEDNVRAIRRMAADGRSQDSIAAEFGVAQRNISFVVRRRTWKHVV